MKKVFFALPFGLIATIYSCSNRDNNNHQGNSNPNSLVELLTMSVWIADSTYDYGTHIFTTNVDRSLHFTQDSIFNYGVNDGLLYNSYSYVTTSDSTLIRNNDSSSVWLLSVLDSVNLKLRIRQIDNGSPTQTTWYHKQ